MNDATTTVACSGVPFHNEWRPTVMMLELNDAEEVGLRKALRLVIADCKMKRSSHSVRPKADPQFGRLVVDGRDVTDEARATELFARRILKKLT